MIKLYNLSYSMMIQMRMINIGSKTLAGIENRVLLINGKILIVLHENFRNTFYSVLYLH